MLADLIFNGLFFAIPAGLLVLFGVCFNRYHSAKKQNQEKPGSVSAEELKKRKLQLILVSIVTGVLLTVVIGFVALMFMAIAFM